MNRILPRILIASIALLLSACASHKGEPTTLFDLGPAAPRKAVIDAPIAALVVSDATGSAAMESERMFYRLNYADAMQARAYANSRWSTNPLEMVTQRVKTRLAQTGVKVLQPTDSSTNVPILRVEVDDFMHAFESSSQSQGQVVVRASLFRDHTLLDQQTFSRATPAPSANASGGAFALAASLDAVADDIAAWLARVNLKR